MSMDIENIDIFETINQVNTIKWRPIYEVKDEAYFIGSKICSEDFIKECKGNSNEASWYTTWGTNNIKRMTMEQGLYAQLIMLRWKDLEFVATDKTKNEAKFKFQG